MKKFSKRTQSLVFPCIILVIVSIIVCYIGMTSRWYRAPYPSFGKTVAWLIHLPEQAYNFDAVVPGKLYRSGKPDERFLRYVHHKYGIQHLISFTGKEPSHDIAEKLGMNVKIYEWSTRHLPDKKELEEVIEFIDKNDKTLVHCAGGSDRTGYTVAFYRIWRQHWSAEKAIKEMEAYWHQPEKKKALHREINEMIQSND